MSRDTTITATGNTMPDGSPIMVAEGPAEFDEHGNISLDLGYVGLMFTPEEAVEFATQLLHAASHGASIRARYAAQQNHESEAQA